MRPLIRTAAGALAIFGLIGWGVGDAQAQPRPASVQTYYPRGYTLYTPNYGQYAASATTTYAGPMYTTYFYPSPVYTEPIYTPYYSPPMRGYDPGFRAFYYAPGPANFFTGLNDYYASPRYWNYYYAGY